MIQLIFPSDGMFCQIYIHCMAKSMSVYMRFDELLPSDINAIKSNYLFKKLWQYLVLYSL